jgi:hypothetical protein
MKKLFELNFFNAGKFHSSRSLRTCSVILSFTKKKEYAHCYSIPLVSFIYTTGSTQITQESPGKLFPHHPVDLNHFRICSNDPQRSVQFVTKQKNQ